LAAFCLATFLGLSLVLRLALSLAFGRAAQAGLKDWAAVFAAGTWRDLYVGLLLCLPLALGFAVFHRSFGRTWPRRFFLGACFAGWMAQIFFLAADFFFFAEFRSRFNTVAVDYIFYPYEVFVNIWDTYPVAWVVAGCAFVSALWVFAAARLFPQAWQMPNRRGRAWALGGGLALVCLGLGQTIPLQAPHVAQDRALNELANNSALALFGAAWTHNLDYPSFYRTLPLDEAYARTRQLLAQPGAQFVGEGREIRRRIAGDPNRPRLNVVILLEESLGSEFWGSLGRKGATLTPEMDRLAATEGLLFANIYASGNRTVRAFEGVFSSFPPLPGDSIVKRNLSDNVESLARVLKRDGYQTLFLYGGRGMFDGMRSYARRNGYDRFLEQKHFAKPIFTTIWGVCDEDLFARAIDEFRQLARAGQPFLGTVLSVSNHKPYTYPKGRIPEDPEARTRSHAVKYSDYCLGQFFQAARRESFWTNTVFVVVADHGARVYGSQRIPIHSYEIPLLIAGPAVVQAPARLEALGCSLDVSPTILGLLGRPYETLFFGRDLLKIPPGAGRAFLNHNRDVGLFARDRLVVLGLMHTAEFYRGNPKVGVVLPWPEPAALERELEKDCQALYQVADDLYTHRRYHLDPK
jgi:phosphoglycerol transferase MdoB-like AlkP superfamily enzyme